MNNDKGFTLIELLGTIVVIGILLVIVIPRINDTLDASRKGTFLTEAKNVFKMAELAGMGEITSNYISSSDETKLSLDGNELDYCIKMDDEGNILSGVVSNGIYYIESGSNFGSLNATDIVEDDEYTITCGE